MKQVKDLQDKLKKKVIPAFQRQLTACTNIVLYDEAIKKFIMEVIELKNPGVKVIDLSAASEKPNPKPRDLSEL
jgi:hypothetical protein